MMQDLSLHVLDIAQNSISAGSLLTEVEVEVSFPEDRLTVTVRDTGKGMSPEQVASVTDPFFTSRSTRKVGLGVPFFKSAAEMTGGSFSIRSELGKGTETKAVFVYSSIDRMPLGDMNDTVCSLVQCNPHLDFIYRYTVDGEGFEMDTRAFREELGGEVPLDEPEVMAFLREYLKENTLSVNQGKEVL